jgi:hypothetical protein
MWSDEARTHAEALVQNRDPLHVAQMIKARIRPNNWAYLVRKALYGEGELPAPSRLLKTISQLCRISALRTSVLNYNYDNLIESAMGESKTPFTSVWNSKRRIGPNTVAVYYPHGYLRYGGGPVVSIVLGEDDYHEYAVDQYGWRNSIQLSQFSKSVCIFIGCSLTDPQLRRLLWVARRAGGGEHYAFLPASLPEDTSLRMEHSLFDAQLADVSVRVVRYPTGSDGRDHSLLPELCQLLADVYLNPDLLWA